MGGYSVSRTGNNAQARTAAKHAAVAAFTLQIYVNVCAKSNATGTLNNF